MGYNFDLLINNLRRWKQDWPVILLIIFGISADYFSINIVDGYVAQHIDSFGSGNRYNTVTIYLDKWFYDENVLNKFLNDEPLGKSHNILLIREQDGKPCLIGWKGYTIRRWFPVNNESFF
jgi:hypothetical protein